MDQLPQRLEADRVRQDPGGVAGSLRLPLCVLRRGAGLWRHFFGCPKGLPALVQGVDGGPAGIRSMGDERSRLPASRHQCVQHSLRERLRLRQCLGTRQSAPRGRAGTVATRAKTRRVEQPRCAPSSRRRTSCALRCCAGRVYREVLQFRTRCGGTRVPCPDAYRVA